MYLDNEGRTRLRMALYDSTPCWRIPQRNTKIDDEGDTFTSHPTPSPSSRRSLESPCAVLQSPSCPLPAIPTPSAHFARPIPSVGPSYRRPTNFRMHSPSPGCALTFNLKISIAPFASPPCKCSYPSRCTVFSGRSGLVGRDAISLAPPG